mgnify:FL=1
MPLVALHTGDALATLRSFRAASVDLVVGSPPYEDARTYGIDFAHREDEWVRWAADRFMECLRVSRGIVAWVVAGRTQKFRWTATPPKLMVAIERRGGVLRNPCIFHRVGISGSGGPDYFRSDYEWIIVATNQRRQLPWSDNTACGHPPKYALGGEFSYRTADGRRANEHKIGYKKSIPRAQRKQPKLANPGNVIKCVVGGGVMGDRYAHKNEAPFPEKLVERFVRSFCPPDGVVLDPFSGSGTTVKVAVMHGRNGVGIDIRDSQNDIAHERLKAWHAKNPSAGLVVRRIRHKETGE